ncbi:MAG TPA: nascent polypeptide-associated complex protein [Candidatus Thermoplasmatota archaeon]
MKALMKQMGISQEELRGVREVIIRFRDKELHFKDPQVVEVRAQGSTTYQVVGKARERPVGEPGAGAAAGVVDEPEGAPEPSEFPEADVRLVMEQAGCSRPAAVEALRGAGGSPAEAILGLLE